MWAIKNKLRAEEQTENKNRVNIVTIIIEIIEKCIDHDTVNMKRVLTNLSDRSFIYFFHKYLPSSASF